MCTIKIARSMKKETLIQAEILKYLRSKGVFAWRQNNGGIWDAKLGMYRTHTGMKGVPDIIAVYHGRFIGVEIKSEKGKMSPDQFIFRERLLEAGGLYILARSVADVEAAMAIPAPTPSPR